MWSLELTWHNSDKVAAGGSGTDAGNSSPSRVPSAIVVGAVDINDNRASSSNYGSTVDIYAAGVLVTSDWIGSTTVRLCAL